MKLAGIVFIIISAGSVGLQISLALRNRCRFLHQLRSAIQLLKNEIVVCATPLPQAFALMAASLNGSAESVFSKVAYEMNQRRWMTASAAMEQALLSDPPMAKDTELCDLLQSMAAGLGKYDKESQVSALEMTIFRLDKLIDQAEQERSVKSKTYEVLGICAGLSIAILLL